jgi:hypothetical protein
MKYFNTLPTINQPDFNGNYITVTNLLSRAYLLPSLQNNVYLFYKYNIKDSDKPESIAYKYYNNQFRYWQIMYANGLFDANADWPMDYTNFMIYMNDKYAVEANTASMDVLSYTKSTVHHYEQSYTTFNSNGSQKQTVTIEVDQDTYINVQPYSTSVSFPDGSIATKEMDSRTVSIYDYEYNLNESKRQINLIKDVYANDMDSQLASVMR